MNIRQDFNTINQFSRPGTKLKGVKAIVLHYTASKNAPAKNIDNYFENLKNQNPYDDEEDRYASAHYSVDWNEIVQSIPDNEVAYHAGKNVKNSLNKLGASPNSWSIGIEMCIDKNGRITEPTFNYTLELTVYLCKKYGLNENNLWRHHDISGKACPLPWINSGEGEWIRFKNEVAKRLNPQPIQPKPVPIPQWKLDIIKQAKEMNLITTEHNPDDISPKWFTLTVIMNGLRVNTDSTLPWKDAINKKAKELGLITVDHNQDDNTIKWFILAVLLNLLEIKVDNSKYSDWKTAIIEEAKFAGIIKEKHNPDEVCQKWFVLAVTMNTLKGL